MTPKKSQPKQSLSGSLKDSLKNTLTHSVKNLISMASKKSMNKATQKKKIAPKAAAKAKKPVAVSKGNAATKSTKKPAMPAKAAAVQKASVKAAAIHKVPAKISAPKADSMPSTKPATMESASQAPQKAIAKTVPHKGGATAFREPKMTKTKLPATTLAGYGRGQSTSHSLSGDDAVCRDAACENLSTTGGYCRLHYIKNWKKIKRKEVILKEKKLNQYIEELVSKYPDKYLEAIRQDLSSDKDFAKVITDLDLDESLDDFDVDADSEEIIDSIKREFDDESDAF